MLVGGDAAAARCELSAAAEAGSASAKQELEQGQERFTGPGACAAFSGTAPGGDPNSDLVADLPERPERAWAAGAKRRSDVGGAAWAAGGLRAPPRTVGAWTGTGLGQVRAQGARAACRHRAAAGCDATVPCVVARSCEPKHGPGPGRRLCCRPCHGLVLLDPCHGLVLLDPCHGLVLLDPCHGLVLLDPWHGLVLLDPWHGLVLLDPWHGLVLLDPERPPSHCPKPPLPRRGLWVVLSPATGPPLTPATGCSSSPPPLQQAAAAAACAAPCVQHSCTKHPPSVQQEPLGCTVLTQATAAARMGALGPSGGAAAAVAREAPNEARPRLARAPATAG
jgi:hypothetical protein